MLTEITCESLIAPNHPYRRINAVLSIKPLVNKFEKLYSERGAPGIRLEKGLKAMIIQFLEDYSDRQMEKALQENIAVKWFCGYELQQSTPDHSYFGKLRKRLGTKNIAKVFNSVVAQMEERGIVGNTFHFIDATAIITKTALWDERDKAIKDGLEKLNNKVVGKYAADKDARFACKGKSKFWFGYKRHVRVDMKSGAITKVAATPGNVPDGRALRHVCPKGGMVFADKGYCGKETQREIRKNGCHSGVIKKNNMHGKNFKKDAWLTRVRMPYEGVFSKLPKRARYRGIAKVQMQIFMEAVAHNLKRWIRIEEQLAAKTT